jgi:3-oxosteroid 1-dehydrogenase
VEGIPFDAAELGSWRDKVQPPLAKSYGFVVKTNELRAVQYFNRAPRAFAIASRVLLRTAAARIRRRDILTNGASLIAQMLKALIELGGGEPPLWTNAAMEDLMVEDGRIVGARITRDGSSLNIQARKGVLLAAGGFAHNAEMRRRYSGNQPNEGQWSIANPGDTGEVLQTAMRLGAKTDLLNGPCRRRRRIDRRRAAATGGHLRRLDRSAVLQRVEFLRRGRQGDVRQ